MLVEGSLTRRSGGRRRRFVVRPASARHGSLAAVVSARQRAGAAIRGPRTKSICCCASPTTTNPSSSRRRRTSPARALNAGSRDYPRQFGRFRDSDGRPPRHTFFYPEEEYEAEYLDALADLCRAGFGEVEIHLHHDHDTADHLRQTLLRFKDVLSSRHGLLPCRRDTGELMYGFIHGNWALDNSRPDGRHCGVNNEIDVLLETGCYADFTLPSAPSLAQTRTINRIYYAD